MAHESAAGTGPERKKPEKTSNARNASRKQIIVSEEEAEFLEELASLGLNEVAASLRKVHDWALYESDVFFDRDEKIALFHMKVLWEALERMAAS